MSHEPKSPSLGMLSTATRTTATVSPLTPSPLNGSIVPNGSPAASSTLSVQAAPSSSFAAALRKLAKQAEEPRGRGQGRGQGQAAGGKGWGGCQASVPFPAATREPADGIFSPFPELMSFPGVVSRGGSLEIQFSRSNPNAVSLAVPREKAWESAGRGEPVPPCPPPPAPLPPTALRRNAIFFQRLLKSVPSPAKWPG